MLCQVILSTKASKIDCYIIEEKSNPIIVQDDSENEDGEHDDSASDSQAKLLKGNSDYHHYLVLS